TSPWVFYFLYRLGKDEGVWNRPTESGSRWQTGGAFSVDKEGIVRWAHVSNTADVILHFKAAAIAAGIEGVKA
ncbi:hypothetical protein, partial [Klebsiella pneumoniae]|uniref:hypothetical protein n=1 Tax=Klebsiella pneumoniae TaxID=573 RepID=UPI001E451835